MSAPTATTTATRRRPAITYKLTRELQLKSELRRDWLRSNTPGGDYTADVILFGLRLQR